jgi:MFS family permease
VSENPSHGPATGEALIGPPPTSVSSTTLPVTVAVPRRTHRRIGAHTPPGGDARPVTLVAFDPRQLRRSVVSVLVIVTLWLLALGVFTAIGHFLFILMLSWLFAIAMEPAIDRLTARGMRRGTATGIVGGTVVLVGLVLAALFGAGPLLPRRSWAWVFGLVLIVIGMGSMCCLPATVPLLIWWLKPETKAYFTAG